MMTVSQQTCLREQLLASSLNFLEGGGDDGASGDAYDVPSGKNIIELQPDGLPHQPSRPVALDRIADASAGGEAETTVGKIVGKHYQDHQPVFVAASLAANLLKAIFVP